ncbi:TetR/AcrR family transcriptional regulator [Roseococcus sp.]|uniref:TetR/AcrR family transcriptional regulator n=1 Tax=Roseococcus sp. TaxID=2109646 RepID=UPI003BAD4A16
MPDTVPPVVADARTRILDAAEHIVQAKGVAGLTLDAAARQAGVSKGGLLYHFASKQALLIGLLTRLSDSIEADFQGVLALQPPGRGRIARAMLAWTFDHPESVCEQHERAAGIFLAAFHQDRALLDPIRRVFDRVRSGMHAEGLPPGHALAVSAACDGLFMSRVFEMYELSADELKALRAALETLIGDVA